MAYLRLYKNGELFSIGRVVVSPKHRGQGLGKIILNKAISHCKNTPNAKGIKISAQTYLLEFYHSLGFSVCSKEYLEDNIAHIDMKLKL